MKPNPQFIQMITTLYQKQKKSITREDLDRHNARAVTFYSISEGKFVNDRLVAENGAFSEQQMIEIEQGAKKMIVGTPYSQTTFTRLTSIRYEIHNGNGFLHWQAMDEDGVSYLIARITTSKGEQQIKIANMVDGSQSVHNVCELPG